MYLGEDSDGEADDVMILAPAEERPSPPFYFQTHSPLFSCSFQFAYSAWIRGQRQVWVLLVLFFSGFSGLIVLFFWGFSRVFFGLIFLPSVLACSCLFIASFMHKPIPLLMGSWARDHGLELPDLFPVESVWSVQNGRDGEQWDQNGVILYGKKWQIMNWSLSVWNVSIGSLNQ